MDSNPRVLGVDAGFVSTGLVIVEARPRGEPGRPRVIRAESPRTSGYARRVRGLRAADDDATRCQLLARAIGRMVAEAGEGAVAAVELPTAGARGGRANRCMGMATGVVTATLAVLGVPVVWIAPDETKMWAAGKRGAPKEAVQDAVLRALDWSPVVPIARKDGLADWRSHFNVLDWENVADAAGAACAAAVAPDGPLRALGLAFPSSGPGSVSPPAARPTSAAVNPGGGPGERGGGLRHGARPPRQRGRS